MTMNIHNKTYAYGLKRLYNLCNSNLRLFASFCTYFSRIDGTSLLAYGGATIRVVYAFEEFDTSCTSALVLCSFMEHRTDQFCSQHQVIFTFR